MFWKRINNRNKKINSVPLFHKGQFFVWDAEGDQWELSSSHLKKEIKKRTVEEVAVAGDSLVVYHDNFFESSVSVDQKLVKKLTKFFSDQRR